jgi:hypothetical protein
MLQTERRRNPYPLTWEIPVGAATMTLVLAALGVQLGRSLAHYSVGAGWTWPHGRALFTSITSVLAGQPTAGLQPTPAVAATPGAVTGWIIAVELVLLILAATAAVLTLRRWGPGRLRGMATPAQTRDTLGALRLRRVRTIIRPDLYPPPGTGRRQ